MSRTTVCTHASARVVDTRAFCGPAWPTTTGARDPRAHGGICETEWCDQCGASRTVNRNQGWEELGTWRAPMILRLVVRHRDSDGDWRTTDLDPRARVLGHLADGGYLVAVDVSDERMAAEIVAQSLRVAGVGGRVERYPAERRRVGA